MNNLSFPNCSVCLDFLVAPVTTYCGHSTCITCYASLTGRCPECRSFISRDCKLNIVLDQVLSGLNPEYDLLKREKMKEINRKIIFDRYIASKRYTTLIGLIRDKLRSDGNFTIQDLRDNIETKTFEDGGAKPSEQELLYLLEQLKPSIVKLRLNDEIYYIYRGDLNINHIIKFAEEHAEELKPCHLYILASSMNTEVEKLFSRLNLCNKGSEIVFDRETLGEFLSAIDLSPPTDDKDIDTDSSSDSD